ncbi:hypothetical protein N510_002458 [Firmicutes bacterium ASF500]|nr:hypothetical protein N510_002458 [Firmicutes bacterium ASF500]
MKVARFVLKIVALSLATAAAVCAVIAYWDGITEMCCSVKGKIQRSAHIDEYDDYDDYEE